MQYINLFTNTEITQTTSAKRDGGKGYNLIKMKRDGLNVPSGLVISTKACNTYRNLKSAIKKKVFIEELMGEVKEGLKSVWKDTPHRLLSIRSGAEISMAGMMDTLLNVGVGYKGHGLKENALLADCEKRFTDMFVDVVLNSKSLLIDNHDELFHSIVKYNETIYDVIEMSIIAVFNSWDNERAKHYRKMYNISDDLGTAVVIQSMVFGNYNDNSGSGVMFTRDPNTGAKSVMGEYLVNCQGEDVVAGTATPLPISDMADWNQEIHDELVITGCALEVKNKDMQDIEFTIQDGELFILQTRNGKRSALAEVVIAQDLLEEGLIDNLNDRIHKGTIARLSQPSLPTNFKVKPKTTGLPSGGYLATGRACYSVQEVMASNEPNILVAEETTPDDIKGMEKAVGILTTKGGATSHAAVVARGMNKPCVVGCLGFKATVENESETYIMINGQTGEVWVSETKFEIDLTQKVPVEHIGFLLSEGINESTWVTVNDKQEALDLEEYLYNVIIPSKGLTESDLLELAPLFNTLVVTTNVREDTTSLFIGSLDSSELNNQQDLDSAAYSQELSNVYMMGTGDFLSPVIQEFHTMADVMNPEFIGTVDDDFITQVMGGMETYELVCEQVGLEHRILSNKSVLDVLDKWVEVG